MVIGTSLLTALGVALLATLAFCLITSTWQWRSFIAYWVFGAILVFGAIAGPIRIGS